VANAVVNRDDLRAALASLDKALRHLGPWRVSSTLAPKG